MAADRLVHHALAGIGEGDQLAAPVLRVGSALDQAGAFQAVEAIGHAARRDHRGFVEPGRRQHVGLARTPERREHVEFAPLQARLGEQRVHMIARHAFGGIGQSSKNGHRQRGELGAFAGPLFDGDIGAVHRNPSRRKCFLTSRYITHLLTRAARQ